MDTPLTPVSFDALRGWDVDDPTQVLAGLAECARHCRAVKPYRTGSLGVDPEDLAPAFKAAEASGHPSPEAARRFFEDHFVPVRIGQQQSGFVTAYYEPEIDVSDRPDGNYRHPIHRRPGDLVEIDDGNRPTGFPPSHAFGRQSGGGVSIYPDRKDIDTGYLQGLGLEIAWARSRIDVFFMHIQGSARLRYPDGCTRRVTYAAKTGHPYTAIGAVLVESGEMRPEDVTMDTLKGWLADHPDRADEMMWRNRSYIFFREVSVDEPDGGPVGAAKVPLRAGRSLAVDRLIHTFGTPFYVQADDLVHLSQSPFRRSMLAQDTGSAIVGPTRGDIFVGSGPVAGSAAGCVRHQATFFAFIPRGAAQRILQ